MKKEMICIKCSADKIKVIKALPSQMKRGFIPKLLNPNYYICSECGYIELWVDSDDELAYIKKHY